MIYGVNLICSLPATQAVDKYDKPVPLVQQTECLVIARRAR